MGGGNIREIAADDAFLGLSPRGRGKLGGDCRIGGVLRSIPAWAGETSASDCWNSATAVYPRVGGGNGDGRMSAAQLRGLSPRGRGKLQLSLRHAYPPRSIPAWAGETTRHKYPSNQKWVYPRVGGGNTTQSLLSGGVAGLSPRGRGKPSAKPSISSCGRSIPAWAGETSVSRACKRGR